MVLRVLAQAVRTGGAGWRPSLLLMLLLLLLLLLLSVRTTVVGGGFLPVRRSRTLPMMSSLGPAAGPACCPSMA